MSKISTSSNKCYPLYTIYDKHQLVHVSTPRCHLQGVVITKVYKQTCQYMFRSLCTFIILLPEDGTPLSKRVGVDICHKWRRPRLKCDGTRAETRVRLSAKRTSPIKSAGASVQSTTGSRGVRISGSNAGYTMFRGSVKGTGYPLHLPVSPTRPLPCVTVCHHISTGLNFISTLW